MKIIKEIFTYAGEERSAVTIGKFDGVHLGHTRLIERTCARAHEAGAKAVVVTFDMAPALILSKKERRKLFEEMGVDVLVECGFTPKLIAMSAEHFVKDILLRRLNMIHIAAGEDFRFGYGREGDASMLKAFGEKLGFSVDIVPEVDEDGEKISSTRIREALAVGDMEKVRRMLGFTYYLRGSVIHGRQIGRTIGIPTANLIPDKSKLLPPNGVYFSTAEIAGKTYGGITNIGTKPTVDGHFVGAETFFFDFEQDIYDEVLEVRLLHYSRPERKFSGIEELSAQIHEDEKNGREYFSR